MKTPKKPTSATVKKSPRKQTKIQDIPFDPPYDSVVKESLTTESPRDWSGAINNVCMRYIIADQSGLIKQALMNDNYNNNVVEDEFKVFCPKFIKNYTDEKLAFINKWYLVANDFASYLNKYEELVLVNHQGTWWGMRLDEDHPLMTNKTLINIVQDVERFQVEQERIAQEIAANKAKVEEFDENGNGRYV